MRCNETADYYLDRMTRAWVPLALTDAGFLNSILLSSCRHLSIQQHQQRDFYQLAAQYKIMTTRSLMDGISAATPFRDATVATAVMLAYDEVRRLSYRDSLD